MTTWFVLIGGVDWALLTPYAGGGGCAFGDGAYRVGGAVALVTLPSDMGFALSA